MIRGYSLKDGKQKWQYSMKGSEDDFGVPLGRACDVDCTLPCDLVSAGKFGAINPSTGEKIYNMSKPSGIVKDGVAYAVHVPELGSGKPKLVAKACANSKDVLWSSELPTSSDDDKSWSSSKMVVVAKGKQTVVVAGGHDGGYCFRGHCTAMHSAIVA